MSYSQAMKRRKRAGSSMTVSDNTFWLNTYEEHGSSVLAFLTSRVGRRDVAEDLLQETFVRVMRRGKKLTDTGKIRGYLFTTAHHLILDRLRKKKPTLFSEISEEGSFQDVPDPGAESPQTATDLRWFGERLNHVVEALRPAHRVAFRSAVLEERPYAEVAAAQGWSLEQVKTNVHRARKQVIAELRDLLCPTVEN